MRAQTDRFDEQAPEFERRVGLDAPAGRAVAQTIHDGFRLREGDVVLEIGAGTGTIGRHFAELPIRYVGLDLSGSMLAAFRQSVQQAAGRLLLVRADADRPWPIGDGAIGVVFASRAAHLLETDRFVRELMRTCRSGGYLAVGRVARERDSIKHRLRHRKRAVLAELGLQAPGGGGGGGGGDKTDRLMARSVAAGATPIATKTVAHWTSHTTPGEVIGEWEARSDFGGFLLDAERRAAVFHDLRAWAHKEFGSLDRAESSVERYAIGGVRLP